MARKTVKTAQQEKEEQNKRRLELLERDYKHLKESFIPTEPTYLFKVGDEVKYGALLKSVVTEVLDGGRGYKLHVWAHNENYGNPFVSEEDRLVSWLDVRKVITEETPSLIENAEIRFNYYNTRISAIFHNWYYFGTNNSPEYQRELVWELADKVALIDSIFRNIEIGKFAFIDRGHDKWMNDGKMFEILDGKQRLNALTEFYEDKFQYKGKFFSDLCSQDKWHFMEYNVSVADTEPLTDVQRYKYFLRLNTSGKPIPKEKLAQVEKLLEESLAKEKTK